MRIEKHAVFWVLAALALLGAIALLRDILLPFVAGTVIAYFLNPIADKLERIGFNRLVAALLIVLLAGVVVVAGIVLLVPFVADQLRQLSQTLPEGLARLSTGLESWAAERLGDRFPDVRAGIERALKDLSQSWAGMLGQIARGLWSQGMAVANLVSLLLVTPIVVFYLLVDWHPMIDRIDSWLPRDHAATIRTLCSRINTAVAAFIRGQGTICLLLGVLYAVALTLIGLRYGALIGLATGALSFIPYVGWALGLISAGAAALAQSWPDLMLPAKVVAIFAVGMAIDSTVLSPKIVGEKVGLHPVWMIFAIFAFSYLFGFVGVLVAVPAAAAFAVLARHAIDVYLDSPFYRGDGGTGGARQP